MKLETIYGLMADGLRRALHPIHTTDDGRILRPKGYSVEQRPGLRRHKAERVVRAQAGTIDSLGELLGIWTRHRLLGVQVDTGAGTAIATVIDAEEHEAGSLVLTLPLSLSARALLALCGDWRPYAELAELLTAPDLRPRCSQLHLPREHSPLQVFPRLVTEAMDERDRAMLTRLRAAKSAELDQEAAGGAVRVTWTAKGAEATQLPRALLCTLVTIEDGECAPLSLSEPIDLRPGEPLPSVRLRTPRQALERRIAQAIAEELGAAYEPMGVRAFAGSVSIERWRS